MSGSAPDARNRRALVTGAAAGLAAGIAPALAADGFAQVTITWRSTPPDDVVRRIETAGARAGARRIDFLDDERAVEAALDDCVREDGPFDTLVHAVGPLVVKRFERSTMEDYHAMLDGNLRSAVLAARAVLPAMRSAGFGRIVFFGMYGAAETLPARGLALHLAAKSALTAFARTLAVEEAHRGITVNVVVPGDIRDKSRTRAEAFAIAAPNPRGRPGTWEDIADVVRFLVAPERDFVTGAVIAVTGGARSADERNETSGGS
jgi:3-oxoacyl-[acyl-carrier protein] reductase